MQQTTFCQRLSVINTIYKESDSLMNRDFDMRVIFNEIDENISGYITLQDTPEGRVEDLPKIEESHKDILFTNWDIQLK